jgi:hypothetical protein
MEGYEEDFLSKEEGSSRSAVKRMTRKLELEMMKLTINAPDWWVPQNYEQCVCCLTDSSQIITIGMQ